MTPPLDLNQFAGHTPGPWTFDSRGRGFIRGADHGPWDSTIAILCEYATKDVRQQRQAANACLLVKAPTLLAEVRELRAERERLREALIEVRTACDAHYSHGAATSAEALEVASTVARAALAPKENA